MKESALLGTWSLRSFELHHPDGAISHPYGEDVTGILIYDPTGHMSAAFGSAKRGIAASDDLERVGTRVAYDTFMAYGGSYEASDERVVHTVEISSLEAWTGTLQERRYRIHEDRLTLTTLPLVVGAEAPVGHLVWDRVQPTCAPR